MEATDSLTELRLEGKGIPGHVYPLVDDVRVYSVDESLQITSDAPAITLLNTLYSYHPTYTADAAKVTYWSLEGKPEGMTVDAATGAINWIPEVAGGFDVVLVAHAPACDARIEQSISIEVNTPPVITSDPPDTTFLNQPFNYQLTAHDNDGDTLLYELEYGPEGMAVDEHTGLLTWVPLLEGQYDIGVTVSDSRGGTDEQHFSLSAIIPNDAPVITSYPLTEVFSGERYRYPVIASDPDGDEITYEMITGPQGMTLDSGTGLLHWDSPIAGLHAVSIQVADPRGELDLQSFTLIVNEILLPQDPAVQFNEQDNVELPVGIGFGESVAFLYAGQNAIQFDLDESALVQESIAVVRGQVMDTSSQPMAGVKVGILHHSELGYTLTREDGWYDLVVNGGNELVVNYSKQGYLTVQRKLPVKKEDYSATPTVVMTRIDPVSTVVALGENTTDFQMAVSSEVDDGDGNRSASLLFEPGTTARMLLPDGQWQSLESITVRATEYTVGVNGPRAMPGELPPSTGYTYAVELSADEAILAGSNRVEFNQPVWLYVENFIGFPTGSIVPIGWYDQVGAKWIPSENGRVIEILSLDNEGRAALDVDGEGIAAPEARLSELGITDAERLQLAARYTVGQSIWRSPIAHFTPWDCNWPYGPPNNAEYPDKPPEKDEDPLTCEDGGSKKKGSEIDVSSRTLTEYIPLAGSDRSLVFGSRSKVPVSFQVKVTGDTVHPQLKSVTVTTNIKGVVSGASYSPVPDQYHSFHWDGRDAYGRQVTGASVANVTICNVYNLVRYASASEFTAAFSSINNLVGSGGSSGGRTGGAIAVADRANADIKLCSGFTVPVGDNVLRPDLADIGEWQLSRVPQLDAKHATLLSPTDAISQAVLEEPVLQTLIGTGRPGSSLSDTPVDIASDGDTTYIAFSDRIARIENGELADIPQGNGFSDVRSLTIDQNGNLFVLAARNDRPEWMTQPVLWKLTTSGVLSEITGRGYADINVCEAAHFATANSPGVYESQPPYVDNGSHYPTPAQSLKFSDPVDVAVAANGDLFVADRGCHAVYRVTPSSEGSVEQDGSYIANNKVVQIAGNGSMDVSTDAGPSGRGFLPEGADATIDPKIRLPLAYPSSLTISEDDRFLYIGTESGLVRRWSYDDWIENYAGTGVVGFAGDRAAANDAQFGPITDLSIKTDGTLYLNDTQENKRIRRISTEGIVDTVLGDGSDGFASDGIRGVDAPTGTVSGLAMDDHGKLYFADAANRSIRRLTRVFDSFSWQDEIRIAAPGGHAYYFFDKEGKFLREVDALSGFVLQHAIYTDGLLTGLKDADGRIEQLERDSTTGQIVAFTSADGHRTRFEYDLFGRLTTVILPDNSQWQATYNAADLLASFIDPNGHATRFQYDDDNRLIEDRNPEGGGWIIATQNKADFVSFLSGEDRQYQYQWEKTDEGLRRIITGADELQSEGLFTPDYIRRTDPDGTVTITEIAPDPRLGGAVRQTTRSTATLPSGLSSETSYARDFTLSDPADTASVLTTTTRTNVNGNVWESSYDATTRVQAYTTPEGRQVQLTLDERKRPTRSETPGLAPVTYAYDDRGNLITLTEGEDAEARVTRLDYDSNNHPSSVTDALGRTTEFVTDALGRVVRSTLPDGRMINYDYDAKGNLTGLIPPARPMHTFDLNKVDQETGYTPPLIVEGTGGIASRYNLDKQLTETAHDLGSVIGYEYDSAGRLKSRTQPDGGITIDYDNAGRISSITTQSGESLSYDYDGSLPTHETWGGTVNGSVAVEYDNDFNIIRHTINGVESIDYLYDDDGLLVQASDLTLTRDSQNGLLKETRLNNVTTAIEYNPFGEPIKESAYYAGTLIYETSLKRNKLGQITEKTETIDGITTTYTYEYDNTDRLIGVKTNGIQTAGWRYNNNGNRTQVLNDIVASYDHQDRLLSYSNAVRSLPSQDTDIAYVIDGNDRRIARTENGLLTHQWLYADQLNPIAELDGTGTVESLFIYAEQTHAPSAMQKDGSSYRILTDHLGSPRIVINSQTGEIIQRIDYDVWGGITYNSDPSVHPFGYAGGIHDSVTGLVRFGARDYDPVTGRWLAKDPIRFEGGDLNLYAYVGGDPINFIDPLGLEPNQVCVAASTVSGGVIGGGLGYLGGGLLGGGGGTLVAPGVGTVGGAIGGAKIGGGGRSGGGQCCRQFGGTSVLPR